MQPLRLLLALDDRFEPLAEVALASVLLHQSIEAVTVFTPTGSHVPHLHRLCDRFQIPLRHQLLSTQSPLGRLPEAVRPYFYCVEAMASVGQEGRYLYLDADTLCIRSLDALAALRLERQRPFAVCSHGRPMPDRQLCLGLSSTYHYFNAGVILFEASAWSDLIQLEQVVDYFLEHQALCRFREQCALNGLLREHVLYLPSQYNYLSWMRERQQHSAWHDLRANPMAYALPAVREHVAIVHLSAGALPERLPQDQLEAPDRYWLSLRAGLDRKASLTALSRFTPD